MNKGHDWGYAFSKKTKDTLMTLMKHKRSYCEVYKKLS